MKEKTPNHRAMIEQFHRAMIGNYERVIRETPYRPNFFIQIVEDQGGYEAARFLIDRREPSEGFFRLRELGRLDLSAEALILMPEWAQLFDGELRLVAYNRLREFGYDMPAESWRLELPKAE